MIAVLGMHRSGTSCLTGSLEEAGLFLGERHTWNPYNLKGNRENQAFVDFHDGVLAANGGSWDRPPARVSWSPAQSRQAVQLLDSYPRARLLGFKDPRALLLLEGWRKVVPQLECVGVFRHPEAVAQSLRNRSNLEREHALKLWYVYNSALLREHRRGAFPLLCFDEDGATFQRKVVALAAALGLPRQPDASRFYDDGLKQYSAEGLAGLPWRVRRLYRNLRRVSE